MSEEITVKRCHDPALLNLIVRHPEIYPTVGDDFQVPATEFHVEPAIDDFVWLVPYWKGRWPMGFCAFRPASRTMYEYHGGLFVKYRGHRGFAAARAMFGYVFRSLGAAKLMTLTPTDNRAAMWFNSIVGLRREGLLTAAHRSGGRLIDLVVYGLTVEEFDHGN